ncbi:GNAT family N-acetyltransferase [Halobellus captivus]|uniref:GNAT family N-acetyltransferase n=1 Tax=Halobellus captivus TaxID=2592614 RepID=UPI00193A7731|nr:GNAT family N-acetyltransferase [Halobellus captivus]
MVSDDAERRDAFDLRRAVFVEEQGVDEEIEWDEHDEPDADATHFVAYDDGDVVGAARFRGVDGEVGKVERVAVAADRRGEDWGRRVMDAVESHAHADGFDRLALHAQTQVRGFYERLGYDAFGEEFEEAGIPHIEMEKELASNR